MWPETWEMNFWFSGKLNVEQWNIFPSCLVQPEYCIHCIAWLKVKKYIKVKLSLLFPRIAPDIVELLFYKDDRILNNLSSYENSIFHCKKFHWFWHFLSQWLWDEICVTTEDRKWWNIGIRISFICVAQLNNLYKFSAISWWLIKTDKDLFQGEHLEHRECQLSIVHSNFKSCCNSNWYLDR